MQYSIQAPSQLPLNNPRTAELDIGLVWKTGAKTEEEIISILNVFQKCREKYMQE